MIQQASCPHCLDRGCRKCDLPSLSRRKFFFLGTLFAATAPQIVAPKPLMAHVSEIGCLDHTDLIACNQELYEIFFGETPLFKALKKKNPIPMYGQYIQIPLIYDNKEGWYGD